MFSEKIDDRQAAVVRRIFELCATGSGKVAIAKRLNAEAAPAPRAQQGRPNAWAPSSVRAVLYRELYRGEIVWNRTKKRDTWGVKCQRPRPESEWLRVPAPATQKFASSVLDRRQDSTVRLAQSITATRYRKPRCRGM